MVALAGAQASPHAGAVAAFLGAGAIALAALLVTVVSVRLPGRAAAPAPAAPARTYRDAAPPSSARASR